MYHFRARYRVAQHIGRSADLDLHHVPRKSPFIARRTRKQSLKRNIKPRAGSRRPGNQQWAFARSEELRVEQEEWQAAEMVAMEMRQHDAVDTGVIETVRLEGHQ